jgi:hypothetical protein
MLIDDLAALSLFNGLTRSRICSWPIIALSGQGHGEVMM